MKLFSLTANKIRELKQERDKLKEQLDAYVRMTSKELWTKELDEFLDAYNVWLDKMENEDGNKGAKRKSK